MTDTSGVEWRGPRVQRLCDEPSACPAEPWEQLLPPCWEAEQCQAHILQWGLFRVVIGPPVGTGLAMGVLWALHSLRPLSSPGNKETSGGLGFLCFPRAAGRSTAPGVLRKVQ